MDTALMATAVIGQDATRHPGRRVHEVAAGRARLPIVPPALADSIRRRLQLPEQAIFGLMACGLQPGEVAATLSLSEDEVDRHLWRMLEALQPPRVSDGP